MFRAFLPFIDTFQKTEREIAMGCIIAALAFHGDRWAPLSLQQVQAWMREEKREVWTALFRNPFARPDFHALIEGGWVTATGEGEAQLLEVTDKTLARLVERKWAP